MEHQRLAIITGATGLLGRASVLAFLERDVSVLAVGRSAEGLDALAKEAGELGARSRLLMPIRLDLTEDGAVESITDRAVSSALGGTEVVLVNNARSRGNLALDSDHVGRIRRSFIDEFDLGVAIPYCLAVHLSSVFGSRLRAIVNVGSQYGLVAQNPLLYTDYADAHAPHYGATKAALFQLTRELSVQLGAVGTRVNAIALGGVEGREDSEFRRRYSEMLPLGRMLVPSDFIGPLMFLTADESVGMTGHTLAVTGGWEVV